MDAFRKDINLLNKSTFVPEQQPNETVNEYALRLQQFIMTEQPKEQAETMQFEINKKFKKNMKTLTRNDVIIENVMNNLNFTEKNEINKKWTLFSKKFMDTFGTNNRNIKETDILNLFSNVFNEELNMFYNVPSKQGSVAGEPIGEEEYKDAEEYKGAEEEEEDIPIAEASYIEEGKEVPYVFNNLHFLFTYKISANNRRLPIVLMSSTGNNGSFRSVPQSNPRFKDVLDQFSMTKKEFFDEKTTEHPEAMIDFKYTTRPSRDVIGYGIHPEIKNKYMNFGRYIFNYHSLYYKNLFKLYNKKHQSISRLPGVNVSDNFVNIIQKLIHNQHATKEDLQSLSPNERHYFNTIMHVSGLKSHTNSNEIISELKHRLKILEGEIEAGNDNPHLFDEIHTILKKLKDYKIITPKKMNSYLSQIT